jgi:hypothetical protein
MPRHSRMSSLVVATLASSVLAFAQVPSSTTDASSKTSASGSPIAFVYVSSSPSGSTYEINAYTAATNGKLTLVPGSPFASTVTYLAANGKYLFGTNGVNINTFSIASNGAIGLLASIDAQQFNPDTCGGPADLFLDHTGATLYDMDYLGDCANNPYQSFSASRTTGSLTYLGVTAAASPQFETPLSFIGNNLYAYGASCYHFYPEIYGFVRNTDTTLTYLNNNPAMPESKTGQFYCPYLAAADPTNHIAVTVSPLSGNSFQQIGLTQLAVYTADASGNLTTTSTYSNMAKIAVGNAIDLSMAPSGQLLAVSGTSGLQIFHMNGANPITHFTALLTNDLVTQMFWDNANHLYAISNSGKLYVYTITPTSVGQATGSPYTITDPQGIVVLPKS